MDGLVDRGNDQAPRRQTCTTQRDSNWGGRTQPISSLTTQQRPKSSSFLSQVESESIAHEVCRNNNTAVTQYRSPVNLGLLSEHRRRLVASPDARSGSHTRDHQISLPKSCRGPERTKSNLTDKAKQRCDYFIANQTNSGGEIWTRFDFEDWRLSLGD